MDIKIDSEAVQAAMAQQIIATLPDAVKADVVAQAVKALVTAPPPIEYGYGRKEEQPTPLQRAFDSAVIALAHHIAKGIVEERREEVERRVSEACRVALDEFLGEYDAADTLSSAIATSLRNRSS